MKKERKTTLEAGRIPFGHKDKEKGWILTHMKFFGFFNIIENRFIDNGLTGFGKIIEVFLILKS